jgi:Fe-S-cluster containining protein
MPGDCCECGACCFSDSDAYVIVTEDDLARMGNEAERIAHVVDGAHYLKMKDGHCAQLEHMDGDWVCGIYKKRPSACRELERGSPDCLAERELKRLRASRTSKRLLG